MSINLYSYQKDAVERMKNGCILCGDVGLGKSRTALAYYYILNGGDLESNEYFPMNDPPKNLYIITTARKRDTLDWEKEMAPFLLSTDKKASLYSNTVVVDSWNNIHKYATVTNAFFIFDEQRVCGNGKNQHSWVKAFLKIAAHNDWILLSATPGDNWVDYIPVFIANGFYRNRSQFYDEHIITKYINHKYPKITGYINTKKLSKLRDSILVDMDYIRQTSRHYETITCKYDILKYKRALKTRWNPYKQIPITNASDLCYIWRRIVNEDESRQLALLRIFENHPRIIVFYNFDYELDILKNLAYGPDVQVAEWNGHQHQKVPDSESWVYLVQYTAGAEGWNCISTDTIIFYSQSYSYKITQQAAGRIYRLNTPYKDLYYYTLKSEAPIDLAISRALAEKHNFNESRFIGKF